MINPNSRKKILKIIAVAVVICSLGTIAIVSQFKSNTEVSKQAMANTNQIETEHPAIQNISSVISATGTVNVEKSYSISLSTIQEISKVLVDLGDKVTANQPLIEYDYASSKESLSKSLEEANINLKNAQLSLNTYNVRKTDSEIQNLEGAVVTAEKNLYQSQLDLKDNANKIEDANMTIENSQTDIENAQKDIEYAQRDIDNAEKELENAQKDLDNNKQLLDIGAISQQEYQQYETAYDNKQTAYENTLKTYDEKVQAKKDKQIAYETAMRDIEDLKAQTKTYEYNIETCQYNLNEAKNNLEEAKNPTMSDEEKIKYEQQKLQIELAQIKIDDIQSQIDDLTDISTSPIDGTIIEKNVEDGDVAKESEILLKVADTSKLKVTATISEYDASAIQLGQNVTMTSDGIKNKVYTGKVIFIDPQARASNDENVVTIDVSLENSDSNLKPGFTIDLEITTASAENVLTVPVASVMTDKEGQNYVFTMTDNNTLKKVDINTGVYGDMYVEITDGLSENDTIISSPTLSMKDGQNIDMTSQDDSNGIKTQNGSGSGRQNGNGGMPSGMPPM